MSICGSVMRVSDLHIDAAPVSIAEADLVIPPFLYRLTLREVSHALWISSRSGPRRTSLVAIFAIAWSELSIGLMGVEV